MELPLMKCGHTAQGIDQNGRPVCIICFGIRAGSKEVDTSPPNLEGRRARCAYFGKRTRENECVKCRKENDGFCHCEEPSSVDLPFFECTGKEFDQFYCGCHSWD